jgi:hypothetical protein
MVNVRVFRWVGTVMSWKNLSPCLGPETGFEYGRIDRSSMVSGVYSASGGKGWSYKPPFDGCFNVSCLRSA